MATKKNLLQEAEPAHMMLLPAKKGHCQVCAVQHPPEAPHNAQSLFYGMRFKGKYGRDVTWADAVAHCPDEVQNVWEAELRKRKAWTETPSPISEPINADGTLAAVECDRGGPFG